MDAAAMPVIDLRRCQEDEQGPRVVEACTRWGCFRVVNHGVPEGLQGEMKGVVRQLFALPEEVKRRNEEVIAGSGYMAPSELNPLYEAFGLYDAGSPEAVQAFCSRLDATPHQREVIGTYARHLHGVAVELATKIAESMGLAPLDHNNSCFQGWASQFRINKYSFTEETLGSSGVCVHTDSGFLTILQEDDAIGGLEVSNPAGDFVPVRPLPGSLLVNLGDIAKVWSNGRFRNLKHRVECRAVGTRISIALFLLGPREGAVEPPPALVDRDGRRFYRPFTYEGYRKLRVSTESRQGEALELYAVAP